MPDFDKNLQPIIKTATPSPLDLNVAAAKKPNPFLFTSGNGGGQSDLSQKRDIIAELNLATQESISNGYKEKGVFITNKELDANKRYASYNPTVSNYEDFAAYGQSNLDAAANGILKGANLAATTFAGGFGVLYGAAKSMFTGRLADIWDNEPLRKLDEWNNKVDQEYLPNYYTDAEKNAEWYSTDNWFKTNFLFDKLIKNSGFAVGAMYSGNLANVALGAAGKAIGAGASAVSTAAEASQAFRAFTPTLRFTARVFSQGKNIEAAEILQSQISNITDLTKKASDLAKIAKTTSAFSKFGDTGRRTAIALYSSAGEASFEAMHTAKEFRENLIQDFINEKGYEPSGEELKTINEVSESVGATSFLGNMALLSATEYVQLPYLMGSSYKESKQMANSLLGKADNILLQEGKYVAEETGKLGKLYGATKYGFDIKEAGQEIGQYALQVGTQNYWNKAYEGKDGDAWVDGFLYGFNGKSKTGEGVGAFVSKEGMESLVLGGITGGLMQAKSRYKEGKAVAKNTSDFISLLNGSPSFKESFKDKLNSVNRGVILQEEQNKAIASGDKLSALNIKADMMFNYLSARIKYGRYDMVAQDLAEMKQEGMTQEGLSALIQQGYANKNDTTQTFAARISELEENAKQINTLYQGFNLQFSGVVDKDGKQIYPKEVLDKLVYAATKITDYDKRINELSSSLSAKNVYPASIIGEELEGKKEAFKEATETISKSQRLDKEEALQELTDIVTLSKQRKQFFEEFENIKKVPESFQEAEKIDIAPEKLGEKIETEEGEEPLEVGVEYYAETEFEAKETTGTIKKYMRFTVIGQEGDNILIQTADGKKHKIKKEAFTKYKVNKVSSAKSENAVVFMENSDNIFTYNKGKGAQNPKGRISYRSADDSLWFESSDGKERIRITREDLIPGTDKKTGKKYDVAKVFTTKKFTEKALTALSVPVTLEEKLAARNRIVVELYTENKAALEDLNRAITKAQKALEEKLEQIKEKTYTKKGSLRVETNAVRTTLNTLVAEKQAIEKNIEDLKNKKDSLEGTLSYLQDLVDNVRELPQDSKELLSQLKEDIKNLDDLIDSTQSTIDKSIKLLASIEDAIKSAFKYLDKLVSDFRTKNPNVPMDLEALQSQVETFLGEKGAEEYIKNKEGFTQILLDFQELLSEQEKELKIPILTKQTEDLLEKIESSMELLKDLKKEQEAKELVLEKFQAVAEKFQREQAEQERLRKNEALRAESLGSADPGQNIRSDNQNYEADSNKSNLGVVTSSKPTDSDRPHHVRANKFGINFQKFSEQKRARIKAVLVSVKNEAELGLKGLTQYLIDQSDAEPAEKANVDPNKTVVMVMVMDMGAGQKPVLVDENGDEIPVPSLENAVYQVMPDPALKWGKKYGEKSMFRKGTPQEVIDHYTKQYSAWVTSILTNPSMDMYSFDASFGRPEYATKKNEKGDDVRDYDAVVTVEEAGLINSKELSQKPVIKIPATNTAITMGAFTFNSPLGRPLLMVGGVAVPLQNRKLTKNEASTIYKAILQLSKIVNEKGSIKGEDALRLVEWLKSIIYWGKPKNAAGYNSVFFESTPEGLVLKMSGKNEVNISFTKDGIERNKAKIVALLEGMYNNVQSGRTDKAELWEQPYYEIKDFKEDGTPEFREWANYQTYLLSREGRKDEEIPLHTGIRPLKDENDVNRKSVYFTLKVAPTTYSEPISAKLIPVDTTKKKEDPTKPSSDIEAKKADIEKRKTEELDKAKTLINVFGNVAQPNGTVEQKLKEIGGFIKNILGWNITYINASKENNRLELTIDGKQVNLPEGANIRVQAGNLAYAGFNLEDIINAKYDTELAALEGKKEETPKSSAPPKVEGFVLDGKTENTIVMSLGTLTFTSTDKIQKTEEGVEYVEVSAWPANPETAKTFEDKYGSKEKAAQMMGAVANKKVIDSLKAKEAPKPMESPKVEEIKSPIIKVEKTEEKAEEGREPASISLQERLAKYKKNAADNTPFGAKTNARVRIKERFKKFKPENWKKTEEWLKSNFPNIPVFRIKNAIKNSNGQELWGMLQEGAIYVYENAEVGTVYHEVFEAVWKMFSDPAEQKAIIDEFRNRKGSFIDRPTGKSVQYSQATDFEIKEQLAEEFRDYVLYKKIPVKPKDGRPWIVKLFSDLVNAIKGLFIGKEAQTKVGQMFKKIGTGYYKTNSPYAVSLSLASSGVIDRDDVVVLEGVDYRIANTPADKVHEVMQHLTYTTLQKMIKGNSSLFNVEKLPKNILYEELRENLYNTIAISMNAADAAFEQKEITEEEKKQIYTETLDFITKIDNEWADIRAKHEEYLSTYGIEFDENEQASLRDEEKGKGDPYGDAIKIDSFKKANAAIKLLISNLPYLDSTGDLSQSSINGAKLVPASQVFISLMNNLHTSRSIDEMIERLGKMAQADKNYYTLYNALTKLNPDLSDLDTTHDAQVLAAFWRTFKKQAPEVKNVYIFENGDIEVGDSNLTTAANQIVTEFSSNLISHIKEGKSKYFTFSKKDNAYIGEPKEVKDLKLDSVEKRVAFLKQFGINFTTEEVFNLSTDRFDSFVDAVDGIRKSIAEKDKIVSMSNKILDIKGKLKALATLRAVIDNPEFSTTFFNVKGERTQTFIGTNAASDIFNILTQINNKNELTGTQYEYLITDAFAQNSVIMDNMFDSETGEKKPKAAEYMRTAYADGTVNQENGKRKQTSKLSYKERLAQEVNMNLKGFYYSLVPGDASIQWMTYMGNKIKADTLLNNFTSVHKVFEGYFISEVSLSRDKRVIPNAEKYDRNTKDLRFFKDILGEELHNEITGIKGDKKKIKENAELTPEALYVAYKDKIDSAVEAYIKKDASVQFKVMQEYGIIESTETGFSFNGIDINLAENAEQGTVMRHLTAISANFMISNIELHKLLYSDPYQYEDELKRIKNFNSPRQAIINNSPKMNSVFNKVWNRGFDGIGVTNFTRDYFRTTTLKDIIGTIDLPDYKSYKETDGSGIISLKSLRNFRIRAGEWNDLEEIQYRFDIAYEKNDKGITLTKEEQTLLDAGNPGVKSVYTPIKPIVSGNKANGKNYNDILLDKFALYPLSYRILKELAKAGKTEDINALKLYNKMQSEDIDYVIFKSGRKVGAEEENAVYNDDGSFKEETFKGIVNTPFSIISIQAEVPSKENALVTRGSQVTKLVTLDYMEAGVPIDFMPEEDFDKRYKEWHNLAYKEDYEGVEKGKPNLYIQIKNNQKLLEESMANAYESLLKRLGIEEKEGTFKIVDFTKAATDLRNEVIKREVNDNISDAMQGFIDGDTTIEATPAYQQIRNVLYSIADKQVISPKLTGGQKVQIPSSLLEVTRFGKSGKGFTSEVLKFYEDADGKRVCEVMVGRWFKSDKTDVELIEYLNNTVEGQKVLAGIGFRIPTQKQNSIDVFKIKQFLPKEFGDSVVVPAALVEKAGSDFDIDKLSIYLKNVYEDLKGNIKSILFLGYGQKAKEEFAKMFDDGAFLTEKQRKTFEKWVKNRKLEEVDQTSESLLRAAFGEDAWEDAFLLEVVDDLFDVKNIADIKEKVVNQIYAKSLENAYVESMEGLVSHPLNFKNLIKPNSAEQMKDLAEDITKKLGFDAFDYASAGNMLSRHFMSRLRHAFVTGKYAIGIAALNQTNHSLNQRQNTYIDLERWDLLSSEDKYWLSGGSMVKEDATIKFKHFNKIDVDGKKVPTFSKITSAIKNGDSISDIIAQFIDGYVDISKGPWIMELGATPNVTSTWLTLIKVGVPVDDVAYFMNQPIIKDYLASIEKDGYSWLFMKTYVEDIKESSKYSTKEVYNGNIPSLTSLRSTVGATELSEQQKAEQHFMLDEFLKYAKLSEQMFHVTQGSNFDTATFNDPLLIFKKQRQFEKAQNTIISSVDELVENSFLGNMQSTLGRIRNAVAEYLPSERMRVRSIIENALEPYIDLNDSDFVITGQKIISNLFDYAVQTDPAFVASIEDILVSDKNVAKQMSDFVEKIKADPSHPLFKNQVVNTLIRHSASKEGEVNVLKIKNRDNKVYDQNQMIYAFIELREHIKTTENPKLYDRLLLLAVLQSGLSRSPISFTTMLPYTDFKSLYNETLSNLETLPKLELFTTLNVFERNNWNDDDIVPRRKAKFSGGKYNRNMKFDRSLESIQKKIDKGELPKLLKMSSMSTATNNDIIAYTWEKMSDIWSKEELEQFAKSGTVMGYKANPLGATDPKWIKEKKSRMRKEGDWSYLQRGLFKKVYKGGEPLIHEYQYKGRTQQEFIYKAINAWGDSHTTDGNYFSANEFYNTPKQSPIDNGFIKVEIEVSDDTINTYFDATVKPKTESTNKDPLTKC